MDGNSIDDDELQSFSSYFNKPTVFESLFKEDAIDVLPDFEKDTNIVPNDQFVSDSGVFENAYLT